MPTTARAERKPPRYPGARLPMKIEAIDSLHDGLMKVGADLPTQLRRQLDDGGAVRPVLGDAWYRTRGRLPVRRRGRGRTGGPVAGLVTQVPQLAAAHRFDDPLVAVEQP